MKNSKKGVLYAIMAVVGLSGVSARADTPSWLKSRGTRFGTAATGARDWTKQAGADVYDWAGKHKKELAIGAGALAGAAALGAGTRYGYKTYKQRQVVPSIPQAPAISDADYRVALSIPQAPAISDVPGASVVLEKEQKRRADPEGHLAAIRARAGLPLRKMKPVSKPFNPMDVLSANPRFQKLRKLHVQEQVDDDDDWN